MQSELKPCPFCGGEARLYQNTKEDGSGDYDPGAYFVRCDPCDLIHDKAWCVPRDEAIAAWNTRTTPASAADREAIARLRAELERQCGIGAGTFTVDDGYAQSGLWEVNASLDPAGLADALRPADQGEGWVCVPSEPTEAMIAQALAECDRNGYAVSRGMVDERDISTAYAAMLSAAPALDSKGAAS